MGWRRREYYDQWPGRGPFSHLPPWQRPGRAYGGRGYGRGWNVDPRVCGRFPGLPRWWWADPAYTYPPPAPTPQNELGEEKASVEQEISDIETRIKELKSKLETEKKQPTGQ
jgi:hypothetical protein